MFVKIKAIKVADVYLIPITYKTSNGSIVKAWAVADSAGIIFVDELDIEAGDGAFRTLAYALEGAKEVERVEMDAAISVEGSATVITLGDCKITVRGVVEELGV